MSSPPNDQRPIPHAGRPRGEAWRALQREGIEWEGQVLIGADDHVLSARLIITSQRLAFARGGEVVLDITRWWLKRPPYLSGNGAINLRIETGSGARDRLQFMTRDGRQAATEVVTLLTHGKQALPSAPLDAVFDDVPPRSPARRTQYEPDLTQEPAPKPVPYKLSDEHKYTSDVIDATTLQILDTTDFPPVTETQTPSTHHGSQTDGGRMSGDPITISTLANQTHRSGAWSLNPIPSLMPRSSKSNRAGWAFRLSGLIALIALAAAFGADRLPDTTRLTDPGNSILAPSSDDRTATNQAVAQVIATATLPLIKVNEATREAAETAVAIGVGGETAESTSIPATATTEPTASSTNTAEPTATMTATRAPTATATEPESESTDATIAVAEDPTDEPTAEPTATRTATPEPTATDTATPEPTATDTATAQPTATETPTLEPIIGPVQPTTPAPTEPPTNTPTAEPTPIPPTETATELPTATPSDTATTEPSATESATTEPTGTNTPEPTPTPGFPPQGRTVGEGGNPNQVFSTGAFRYTVEFAQRGVEIPTLDLPAVAGSEWVVIVLNAQNWSDAPATLNMADFQLLVSGDFGWQFVGMDASSPDIGRFLGFDPILETTQLTSIQNGEGIRLALVYLIPPSTTSMELIDDTSGLNISPSLAAGGDVTNLGKSPQTPDLIEAVVTEVIDGRTIVVEAGGFPATIQYLGIDVPTGNECYAADATLTNSNIVLGNTVYLEREFRNRVTGGDILARDVWIDNTQGGLVLVSAWMASEGAAVPAPADQDVRFAGWIQAAADAAEANTLGFWAVCGTAPIPSQGFTSDIASVAPVNLPVDPQLTFRR